MTILKFLRNCMLIIFMISQIIHTETPKEEDFIKITANQRGGLGLDSRNEGLGEAYYKYECLDIHSSTIIRLGHKSQEEIDIYIFDSFSSIKRSSESFQGQIHECHLKNEQECNMDGRGTTVETKTYYIIVKLKNKEEIYQGAMVVYNEGYEIPLKLGKAFHIAHTMQSKDLSFVIDLSAETNPNYKVRVDNHKNDKTLNVTLYAYEGSIPQILETKEEDHYFYNLSSKKNTESL